MDTSSMVVVMLVVLCGASPGAAFLQDLLVQPLHLAQQVMQPPYRRAVYEQQPQQLQLQQVQPQQLQLQQPQQLQLQQLQPQQMQPQQMQPQQYANFGAGYHRPVAYQWPTRSYDAGSNTNNPFVTFFQNPWFPWSNRQPQQQPQPQQQQLWGFLPWNNYNNNNNNGLTATQSSSGPVLSFLQNPSGLLAWMQPAANRPGSGLILTGTPAAPAAPAAPSLQQTAETRPPPPPLTVAATTPAAALDAHKMDAMMEEAMPPGLEGMRRMNLQQIPQDSLQGVVLPCP